MPSGGRGSNHTNRTAQDQAGGSHFTPRGAPVVIAIRPEKLLELIIRPGQLRHRIAGKEARPVTAGDLSEVHQRRFECPRSPLVARHRAQESPEATLHRQGLALVLVGEDVGRPMHPVIPHTHVGPQRRRVR